MLNFDPTMDAKYGIPTSIIDPFGSRLLVSEHFADFLGRPIDDLLGMPWHLITHPDDIRPNETALMDVFERGRLGSVRRRLFRGDGTMVEVVLFGVRQFDPRTKRFVVQGNMCPIQETRASPLSAAGGSLRLDGHNAADYIRDIAEDLARLAKANDMAMLDHYLSMARSEADEEIKRRLSQEIEGLSSPARDLH